MAVRRGAVGLTVGMICTIPAAVLAVGSMGAGPWNILLGETAVSVRHDCREGEWRHSAFRCHSESPSVSAVRLSDRKLVGNAECDREVRDPYSHSRRSVLLGFDAAINTLARADSLGSRA